jgi:hypothetical protein
MSPEAYVLAKFEDHDYVFLGEFHRIRHDVTLVQRLIPLLHERGIRHLATEFGCVEDQAEVDRLVTGETYDEEAPRRFLFCLDPTWGYREYMDLYRAAWEVNRDLPEGIAPFRILHLGYDIRMELHPGGTVTPELKKKIWHRGDRDVHMARVIEEDLIGPGYKALVYSGIHHAFTRYHQPLYFHSTGKFYGLNDRRTGNLVTRLVPGRTFTIFLHSPWGGRDDAVWDRLPVGGVIDRALGSLPGGRFGFDVRGSPLGSLQDPGSYYAIGHDNLTLADFCDGYIYQGPIAEYEGCTVDPEFITEENFEEAVASLLNPAARSRVESIETLRRWMRNSADMKRRFANVR